MDFRPPPLRRFLNHRRSLQALVLLFSAPSAAPPLSWVTQAWSAGRSDLKPVLPLPLSVRSCALILEKNDEKSRALTAQLDLYRRALRRGDWPTVRQFLKMGLPLVIPTQSETPEEYKSALFETLDGYLEQLKKLGFNPDEGFDPPLHLVSKQAKENRLKIVSALIELAPNPTTYINRVDDEGQAALHWALGSYLYAAVPLLMHHQPDFGQQNSEKDTPLDLVLKQQSVDGLIALYGEPTEYAVTGLLNLDTFPSQILTKEGRSVLTYVVDQWDAQAGGQRHRLSHLIKELQKRGLPLSVNQSDPSGETPLFIAVRKMDFQAAKVLIEAGANPKHAIRAERQVTPIHFLQNRIFEYRALYGSLVKKWGASIPEVNARGIETQRTRLRQMSEILGLNPSLVDSHLQ